MKEVNDLKVEVKAVYDKLSALEKDIETNSVILNEKVKIIENLKLEIENIKKTPVPKTNEIIEPILDAMNSSIQQNVVGALEPVINNQTESERRVHNLFSDLESQVASLSQVLNSSTTNVQFHCDLCGKIFQNQQSLQNHRRTSHRPHPT